MTFYRYTLFGKAVIALGAFTALASVCSALYLLGVVSAQAGQPNPITSTAGEYHTHVELTDTYENGCIYGEYIAVDVPAGVECPRYVATLH